MGKKLFTKLDARYTGHPHWQYLVSRPFRVNYFNHPLSRNQSRQLFNSWRAWCWQTWGASKELEDWLDDLTYRGEDNELQSHNEHWCWINNMDQSRIYLRSDAELTLFLLRWS